MQSLVIHVLIIRSFISHKMVHHFLHNLYIYLLCGLSNNKLKYHSIAKVFLEKLEVTHIMTSLEKKNNTIS